MAKSTLTVRTLCLATVAFILACGHAARAMGQQKAPEKAPSRVVPSTRSTIKVVPAGSGQTTIATFTAKSAASAGRSGGSRVATFTRKGGAASPGIATFSGDRVTFVGPHSSRSKAVANRNAGPKRGRKVEKPVITVRMPGDPETDAATLAIRQPDTLAATPAAPAIPVLGDAKPAVEEGTTIRNAFAGIVPSAVEPRSDARRAPPILSIQSSAAR